MKKILALLLILVMAVSLSACAKKADDKKVLRVAMECAYAPYNWVQSDNTNGAVQLADSTDYAYGYDVMMAKKIAEKLGYELQVVKLDWESLIPALQSGDVDAVIAGQSITAKRLEQVDFSTPYYYASIVTLVKNDGLYASATGITELSGGKCTSQLGTIWYDVCLPQIEGAEDTSAQETAPFMLVALDAGTVDFVVTDIPTAKAAVSVYDDMKILDFTGSEDNFTVSDEEINLGISVKKGNADLLKAINEVLATMTVDDFETMMNEAISVQPLAE